VVLPRSREHMTARIALVCRIARSESTTGLSRVDLSANNVMTTHGSALEPTSAFVACSSCFGDTGLRLDSEQIGVEADSICGNCGAVTGKKLARKHVWALAHRFFVWGTMHRGDYGGAPRVQFNDKQSTSIASSPWFEADLRLFEKLLGVGFFLYGPRLWMVGFVKPLEALQQLDTRRAVIDRILVEYPAITLKADEIFYRVRKGVAHPDDPGEYDSPPPWVTGSGRLDSELSPVMYASTDMQICVHECRISADDEAYVATLSATTDLRLLDLTEVLEADSRTEFTSLDMAVHMLFLAGSHSYDISRDIGRAAAAAGFDGLVYPSYFSLLRTGAMPFETAYGISLRLFSQARDWERGKMVANLALFGRPIAAGRVRVRCLNRLFIEQVQYRMRFGPVGFDRPDDDSAALEPEPPDA
jgi:hypothetical protein